MSAGLRHSFVSHGGTVAPATNDKQCAGISLAFRDDRRETACRLDRANQTGHFDMRGQPGIVSVSQRPCNPAGRQERCAIA